MRLAVITPVGPGHEAVARDCQASVGAAWRFARGPFTEHHHEPIDDTRGELGRSRARNRAVASDPSADWYFFLDADDLCDVEAFDRLYVALDADPGLVAVFGAVATERDGAVRENVFPLDWPGLMRHGATGTLSMGCFVRGDAARATPFDEKLDVAEDFDFYLRLLNGRRWTKVKAPLALIGYEVPSAGGPRGYASARWREACEKLIDAQR